VGGGRGGSSSAGTRPGFDGAATPSSPRKTSVALTTSEFGESEAGPSAVTTFVNRSDGEYQGIEGTRGKLVDSEVQTEITEEAPKKVVSSK